MSYVMPPIAHSPPEVAFAREDTMSSITQESTVFNKPEDSDIIIEYHGIKFHAQRAILRMCWPFFERIFQSQWSVSKGPVFSLGDDDDPVVVDAMLRHMYNLPYSQSLESGSGVNAYKFHLDVFKLADNSLDKFHPYDKSTSALSLIEIIPYLCGPEAIQPADPSLCDEILNLCVINYTKMFEICAVSGAN
ncbi:hypothetical protein KCU71_g8876, partial [Aureobasidium melanogenum]